jgi:hypothetical protein
MCCQSSSGKKPHHQDQGRGMAPMRLQSAASPHSVIIAQQKRLDASAVIKPANSATSGKPPINPNARGMFPRPASKSKGNSLFARKPNPQSSNNNWSSYQESSTTSGAMPARSAFHQYSSNSLASYGRPGPGYLQNQSADMRTKL